MTTILSHPSKLRENRVADGQNTGQPVLDNRWAMDVISHLAVKLVTTDAVEANSTTSVIVATSHSARVGDLILFTSGNLSGRWFTVVSTSTNAITVNADMSEAPAASDGFSIYRHHPIILDSNGYLQVKVIP
jgi:hypothetical protein